MWTESVGPVTVPTGWGEARMYGFTDVPSGVTHLAMVVGQPLDNPLVRVQSACLFGQVFLGLDCDCRAQLEKSIQLMLERGGGVLLYLAQEGRGVGLHRKMQAMKLQQELAIDTVEAYEQLGLDRDGRDYTDAVAILGFLGFTQIRLLTNAPRKEKAFVDAGVAVTEVMGLETPLTAHNHGELVTKRTKLGHRFTFPMESES